MSAQTTRTRRRDPERTRAAILDAALDLIIGLGRMPTAREIAAEAEVSERTIFVHFTDLEELKGAGALRQRGRWQPLAEPIDPARPFEERLDAFLTQRIAMYALMTPVRRIGLLEEPSSTAIRAAMADGDRWFRENTAAAFAPELAGLPGADQPGGVADALDAVTSWAAWNHLSQRRGLTDAQARRAIEATVRALVT